MSRKKGLEIAALMIPNISGTPRIDNNNEYIIRATARKKPATRLPSNRERAIVSIYLHQLFFPEAALSKNGILDIDFTPNTK
jgi:hypothetical protein